MRRRRASGLRLAGDDRIGEGPARVRRALVRLRVVTKNAPDVPVYAKLEFANPGGSVKDRAALQIMKDALARGDLPGRTLRAIHTPGHTSGHVVFHDAVTPVGRLDVTATLTPRVVLMSFVTATS